MVVTRLQVNARRYAGCRGQMMPFWKRALIGLLSGTLTAVIVGPLCTWLIFRFDRCTPNAVATCSDLAPLGAIGVGVFTALIAWLWIGVSVYQWVGVHFPQTTRSAPAPAARVG